MTTLLPPASIRRCPARSRSFLLGPDGPAGAPPGQRLRSGALIGLGENREQKQDPYYKVSAVRGEPRTLTGNAGTSETACTSRHPRHQRPALSRALVTQVLDSLSRGGEVDLC
jgi:hypothetical protein